MADTSYPGTSPKPQFMSDALLSSVAGLGVQAETEVANVAHSGQLGTGYRLTKLDGATPEVFNPVVPVVLTTPTMWNKFPEKIEMCRGLMETHAKAITGINFGYSLEVADTQIGHDGQTIKVPTASKRSGVNPSASFIELKGNIVYKFFQDWIFDIQHPDTNSSVLPAMGLMGHDMPGWTFNAFSMSMLFIQYDPTGLPDRIIDAYIICDMFPTEIGEIGFDHTIGTTQTQERNITFAGYVQHNNTTKYLGVQMAKQLALHRINYNYALPGVTGGVEATDALQSELKSAAKGAGLNWEANAGNPTDIPVDGSMGSSIAYQAQSASELQANEAIYNAGGAQNANVGDRTANTDGAGLNG